MPAKRELGGENIPSYSSKTSSSSSSLDDHLHHALQSYHTGLLIRYALMLIGLANTPRTVCHQSSITSVQMPPSCVLCLAASPAVCECHLSFLWIA